MSFVSGLTSPAVLVADKGVAFVTAGDLVADVTGAGVEVLVDSLVGGLVEVAVAVAVAEAAPFFGSSSNSSADKHPRASKKPASPFLLRLFLGVAVVDLGGVVVVAADLGAAGVDAMGLGAVGAVDEVASGTFSFSREDAAGRDDGSEAVVTAGEVDEAMVDVAAVVAGADVGVEVEVDVD
jgi:hypothetical protein